MKQQHTQYSDTTRNIVFRTFVLLISVGIVAQQSFKLMDCHENDNHTGRRGSLPHFIHREFIVFRFLLSIALVIICTITFTLPKTMLPSSFYLYSYWNFIRETDNEKLNALFVFFPFFVYLLRRGGGVPMMKLIIVKSGNLF